MSVVALVSIAGAVLTLAAGNIAAIWLITRHDTPPPRPRHARPKRSTR